MASWDRVLAWSLSLATHISLFCMVWVEVGARGHSSNDPGTQGVETITVDFVAIPRVQVAQSTDAAQVIDSGDDGKASIASDSADIASADALPLPEGDLPALAGAEAGTSEGEQSKQSEASKSSDSRVEAAVATAATSESQGPAGATQDDGLEARYRAELVKAIRAHWKGSKDQKSGESCTITIRQVQRGYVENANAGGCALDEETRRQLEIAVLKAQPLPYQGYEAVFREEMQLEVPTE